MTIARRAPALLLLLLGVLVASAFGHVNLRTGEMVATRFGALDAFLPAVLVLGGKAEVAEGRSGTPMFTRGMRLMDSVEEMWTRWPVEPEEFDRRTW